MFKSLPDFEKSEKYIRQRVQKFYEVLKKQDRVTWMCRLLKAWYLRKAWSDNIIKDEEFKKELAKLGVVIGDVSGGISMFDSTIEDFQHMFSLKIAKIDNYEFKKQTISEVMSYFNKAEDEWKKENAEESKRTVPEYGTKIVTFKDGSAWFNLGKEKCEIEGEAMGHCGNAGDPKPGDQVLSYRVPDKDGKWRPYLTFILMKNGYISEMKGRGNDKPLDKFHPQIIKLLESPLIQGITGGGYLPENNFSVTDLDKEDREKLLAKKPTLLTLQESCRGYINDRSGDNSYLKRITDAIKKGQGLES